MWAGDNNLASADGGGGLIVVGDNSIPQPPTDRIPYPTPRPPEAASIRALPLETTLFWQYADVRSTTPAPSSRHHG